MGIIKHNSTRIINQRGWTVEEACEYWGIRYATYLDRANNPSKTNELECMCAGLPDRRDSEAIMVKVGELVELYRGDQ